MFAEAATVASYILELSSGFVVPPHVAAAHLHLWQPLVRLRHILGVRYGEPHRAAASLVPIVRIDHPRGGAAATFDGTGIFSLLRDVCCICDAFVFRVKAKTFW